MEINVFTKSFDEPQVSVKEMLRYAGAHQKTDALMTAAEDCIREALGLFSYKVCYSRFDISFIGETVDLGFIKVQSRMLAKRLFGCTGIVLFTATVGHEIDRLIRRYSMTSPSRALLLGALGSERVESLCDVFCETIREENAALGFTALPRLSPGYSDFPLEVQRDIFAVLSPEKRIGLTLGDSLIMSPSKSVSAIIGIKKVLEDEQ